MKLELDFVRARRRYSWQGMLLLAGGIAAAVLSVQQHFAAGSEVAALERQLAMLAPDAQARGERKEDLERLRARIVLANQVVRRKALPWDGLFRDIESASSSKIGLLGVEPDAKAGFVRIRGEARDAAALTEYIGRLEAQPSLENVHLAAHEIKRVEGRSIVRFNLDATWTGARS